MRSNLEIMNLLPKAPLELDDPLSRKSSSTEHDMAAGKFCPLSRLVAGLPGATVRLNEVRECVGRSLTVCRKGKPGGNEPKLPKLADQKKCNIDISAPSASIAPCLVRPKTNSPSLARRSVHPGAESNFLSIQSRENSRSSTVRQGLFRGQRGFEKNHGDIQRVFEHSVRLNSRSCRHHRGAD